MADPIRPPDPATGGVGDEAAPLDEGERAALAAWDVPAPPDGFAARVLAARSRAVAGDGGAAAIASGRRRRVPRFGPALAIAAVGIGAVWLVARRSVPAPVRGALVASERRDVALGARGVAVVEPGAALDWTVDGDGARLSQSAGSVFYRVEPGGPFTVTTPGGRVEVTGTCFRVEVEMKRPSVQGVVGAALGAAVVVTVYEGSVLFADEGGVAPTRAVAGEVIRTGGDRGEAAKVVSDAPDRSPAPETIAPPADGASRDDLLARDRVQREEIAALRGKLRALESDGPRRAGGGIERDPSGRPWFDPSKEDLARFAAECRLRLDIPPLRDSKPWSLNGKEVEAMGLRPGELDGFNQAMAAVHARFQAAVRAIYVEVTGDAGGASSLSPDAMASEIRDKSGAEEGRVSRQMSLERAGLAPPPADPAELSPFERYYRLLAGIGDEAERELAARVGKARARAIREVGNGWPQHMETAGCPGEARGVEAEE